MTDQVAGVVCAKCGASSTLDVGEVPAGPWLEALRSMALCERCAAERDARLDEQAEAAAHHQLEQRRADRLAAAQIPEALRSQRFDPALVADDALSAARLWADDGGGLLLTGPAGAGKTALAAYAALRRVAGRRVLWCSVPVLLARLGSGLGSAQRDAATAVLTGQQALVLDDLDKARPTEFGAEQIFCAVDSRIAGGRALLVTTNLSVSELGERYPEPYGFALASRLAGHCHAVRLDGPDRRINPPPSEAA